MNADRLAKLEKLLARALSVEEKARLQNIGLTLGIGDNDALWDVVSALEYQRAYYEDLPQKIATASVDILHGLSEAAEAEARLAQGRLAESVAELAQKLAVRINLSTLLPMGLCALVCLLAYGSLSMWSGYRLGSGQAHSPEWLLRMPSAFLMAGLLSAGGLFLVVHAAREFAEGEKGWWKQTLAALTMLVAGAALAMLGM